MSREAFEKWYFEDTGLRAVWVRPDERYTAATAMQERLWRAWQAAQQHSGEPVAWMSPNKQSLEFSRPDTVYGSHTIPLYTNPQPVVPPQWRVVMRGMVEYAECNDPGNPYLDQAKALLSAGKGGE